MPLDTEDGEASIFKFYRHTCHRPSAKIDHVTLSVHEWKAEKYAPARSQYTYHFIESKVILRDVLQYLEADYEIDRLVANWQSARICNQVNRTARGEIEAEIMFYPEMSQNLFPVGRISCSDVETDIDAA